MQTLLCILIGGVLLLIGVALMVVVRLIPTKKDVDSPPQSVNDMNTFSLSRHGCGHHCVRASAEKGRLFIKPLHFVCYACKNLPGAELCRSLQSPR